MIKQFVAEPFRSSSPFMDNFGGRITQCVEAISSLFDHWDKYFEYFSPHSGVDVSESNTIAPYGIIYGDWRIDKSTNIDIPYTFGGICFFEWGVGLSATTIQRRMERNSGIPFHLLKWDNRPIALYNEERNLLICSDWSHCREDMRLFFLIEHAIREIFGLRERFEHEVKPKDEKKANTVTIGCDPEFEVVNSRGIIISASGIGEGGTRTTEEIGVDGAGAQIELRPKAGTPDDVVNHLHRLFDTFCQRHPDLRLVTSGHTFPLGGHIHVGLGFQCNPPLKYLQMLDDFVGKISLPLSGIARKAYKHYTKWEPKPWGFEYRTPPAIIFQNKRLAKIFMKMVKNLTEMYIAREGKEIFYRTPVAKKYYRLYAGLTSDEIDYMKGCLKGLKENFIRKRKMLIAAWGLNETPPEKVSGNITFEFSDEWSPGIRNSLMNYVLLRWKSLEAKDKERNVHVRFFGFANSRGLVSNIPISGMDLRNHNSLQFYAATSSISFSIGLPYAYRSGQLLREEENVEEEVWAFLESNIKRYSI